MHGDGQRSRHRIFSRLPHSGSHERSAPRFVAEGSGVLAPARLQRAASIGRSGLCSPSPSPAPPQPHDPSLESPVCGRMVIQGATCILCSGRSPEGYACRKVYMKQLWAALCPKLGGFRHSDVRPGPELARKKLTTWPRAQLGWLGWLATLLVRACPRCLAHCLPTTTRAMHLAPLQRLVSARSFARRSPALRSGATMPTGPCDLLRPCPLLARRIRCTCFSASIVRPANWHAAFEWH